MLDIFRKIYLNSFLYDNKISGIFNQNFEYKPSTYLLTPIIKVRPKKFNIEEFSFDDVWTNNNLDKKQVYKLNNFFWLFSLDLKSSNFSVQKIIKNWIEINHRYNSISWNFETTSKRLISWLSNSKLTYDESNNQYKKDFNNIVYKQASHILNQIDKIDNHRNKLVGTAAIILVGLCYKDNKNFIFKGLNNLKKIIKNYLDSSGFPKSRNIKTAIFFLKYFILIREWFKESQNEIPEFINENIFYLGQAYAFFWKNIKLDPLFNGNNISDNKEFDIYLKRLGYSFKNDNHELSDYLILKNKKINFIMDVGSPPNKNFSYNYQAGALSFEFASNGEKLLTNSGYFNKNNSKLNMLSKSSAVHNVLIVDDNSSCKFKKNSNSTFIINTGLKIIKKEIIYEKDYWKINAGHDGYLKKYNLLYERQIEFFPEDTKLVGKEKIIGKKEIPNLKFDIRFHLNPYSKIMKTQDNKSIFIELKNEGWKFTCTNHKINIDNGFYFGRKNSHIENQNIYISGITNSQINNIEWEFIKI